MFISHGYYNRVSQQACIALTDVLRRSHIWDKEEHAWLLMLSVFLYIAAINCSREWVNKQEVVASGLLALDLDESATAIKNYGRNMRGQPSGKRPYSYQIVNLESFLLVGKVINNLINSVMIWIVSYYNITTIPTYINDIY